MRPWWDSMWLWSGISIVVVAAITAVVGVIIVAMLSRDRTRRGS